MASAKTKAALCASVLLVSLFLAVTVCAEMYRYVDRNGREHYTDNLGSVPDEYRDKAVRIDRELEHKPGFFQEPGRSVQQKPEPSFWTRAKDKLMAAWRDVTPVLKNLLVNTWVRTGICLAVAVALYFAAGAAAKAAGLQHMTGVIRIVLIFAVLAFAVYMNMTTLNMVFLEAKDKLFGIKEKQEERVKIINEMSK